MQSKIVDASAYAKRLRQEKNIWRQRVLKKYRGCKSEGKRVVEDLLSKYRSLKRQEYVDADKKVSHYRDKNERDKSMKKVPASTSEFLSKVNIFSPDHEIVPEPPQGPFICSDSIKLSAAELKILSRGPKFMIREDLSREDFKVDVEKCVVKKKYDNFFNVKEDESQCESAVLQHEREGTGSAAAKKSSRVNFTREEVNS